MLQSAKCKMKRSSSSLNCVSSKSCKRRASLSQSERAISSSRELLRQIHTYLDSGGLFKGTASNPVKRYYNVYEYAWQSWQLYLSMYINPCNGNRDKFSSLHSLNTNTSKAHTRTSSSRDSTPVLLVGMNPGPWGMAQTGVPFGEIKTVGRFLGINETSQTFLENSESQFEKIAIGKPKDEHEKRQIEGFACTRSEVSGRRLWGFLESRFKDPIAMSEKVFVYNYCPLVFMGGKSKSGIANITPDKLSQAEREFLYGACNKAMRDIIEIVSPDVVVGVGLFASSRLEEVLSEMTNDIPLLGILQHPSPVSPSSKVWDSASCFNDLLSGHSPVRDLDMYMS